MAPVHRLCSAAPLIVPSFIVLYVLKRCCIVRAEALVALCFPPAGRTMPDLMSAGKERDERDEQKHEKEGQSGHPEYYCQNE